MCYIIILMCLLVTSIGADSVPEIKLKLSILNNIVTCDQSFTNPYVVTAYESKILHLSVDYDSIINNITCFHKGEKIYTKSPITQRKKYTIPELTADRRGDWKCELLTNRDVSAINFTVNINGTYYVKTECYINVHMRLKKAPQNLLMNHMLVESRQAPPENNNFDHYAVYKYKNGDKVDMLYYIPEDITSNCYMNITHNFFETKVMSEIKFHRIVSANLQMKTKHNSSYIDCKYVCDGDYQILRTTFILANRFNSGIDLLINGREARVDSDSFKINNSYRNRIAVNYIFNKGEYLDINCNVEDCGTCTNNCIEQHQKHINISNIEKYCNFDCRKGADTEINLNITMTTMDIAKSHLVLSFFLKEKNLDSNVVMSFNTIQEKILIRVMYYEYNDYTNDITVNCNKTLVNDTDYETAIWTNYNVTNNSLNVTLRPRQDEVFECFLNQTFPIDNKPLKEKIMVVFIHNTVHIEEATSVNTNDNTNVYDNTEEDTEGSPNILYIYIGSGIVTGVLTVCISIVLYKLFKRNETKSNHNYENFNGETIIPPHPSQWSDKRHTPEEFRQPVVDTYATPLPKHLRNRQTDERNSCTYAEIGNVGVTSTGVTPRPELSPYAEVKDLYRKVPDIRDNDETYTNYYPESSYVNCFEPTYAETFN